MRRISNAAPLLLPILLALTAVDVALAKPFKHKFGELREYHQHWLAVCPDQHDPASTSDYERNCWASTYTSKGNFFLANRLSVSRNRQDGTHAVTFVTDAYKDLKRNEPIGVRFSDGTAMDFAFGTSIRTNGNTVNEFQIGVENTQELLAAMKHANHMTLLLPTIDGTIKIHYSMLGLTAALQFTKDYARPGS